jgi:Ca2+/Na+ antiporter
MVFLRLFGMGFVVLTVIYICLSFYSRAARREKLERQWEEDGMEGDKRAFVKAGLKEYDGSLRRKLILGVYVVPVVVIGTIIYVFNYA